MDLIINVLLAVLLCIAIGYGFILNRRIVGVRKAQQKLDKLAKNFAEATTRAESSIIKLKTTSDLTSETLGQTIEQAIKVKEDLLYLSERGNVLADKLETSIRGKEANSSLDKLPTSERKMVPVLKGGKEIVKGDPEQELIKALRAVR